MDLINTVSTVEEVPRLKSARTEEWCLDQITVRSMPDTVLCSVLWQHALLSQCLSACMNEYHLMPGGAWSKPAK